mgnify:CR=1 FL=1
MPALQLFQNFILYNLTAHQLKFSFKQPDLFYENQ